MRARTTILKTFTFVESEKDKRMLQNMTTLKTYNFTMSEANKQETHRFFWNVLEIIPFEADIVMDLSFLGECFEGCLMIQSNQGVFCIQASNQSLDSVTRDLENTLRGQMQNWKRLYNTSFPSSRDYWKKHNFFKQDMVS